MTRPITSGELIKLRAGGQWSEMHVILDRPDVVYSARASGPVSDYLWSIPFTNGSGTLGDCLPDMTLLIGSSAGEDDIGVARLRKAPEAGILYVGLDPSLQVKDGDYLTVIDDFGLFAIHTLGDNLDMDVVYSNQFTSFAPVGVVDGGRISVINEEDTIELDASGSWVPGSTISDYSWAFPGAAATSDTSTATPSATYDTSGRYRWALTLTAVNGKTSTCYGWVYVLGDNLQPEDNAAVVGTIDGSEDGWGARLTMYDRPEIRNGIRVVIYAEDHYLNEPDSLGPYDGKENIIMSGWIMGETIVRKPGSEKVEFEIGGPISALAEVASLQIGLINPAYSTDNAAPVPAWAKMGGLTAYKALHYLISHRSTIAKVCDVMIEDWGYPVHAFTADGDNLLAHLDSFAANAAMKVTADRFGVIHIERDGQLYSIDLRETIPVVMTLTDADWQEDFAIVRRQGGDICMAEAEGYIFSGSITTQVGGRSPGDQPSRWGEKESLDELNVSSQATVLELAGLLAGSKNVEYEAPLVIMGQMNRFIDVAPRQFVNVTVDGEVLRCFPRRVIYRQLEASGFLFTEMDLEPEGGQWPAVAIDYPGEGEPPVEPPTEPPSDPPMPPDEPPTPPEIGDADAVVVTSDDVRITGDLDEASPTWTSIISGGPGAPVDSDLSAFTNDLLMVIEDNAVWRCDGVTGTPDWTKVWDADTDFDGSEFGGLLRVRMAYNALGVAYVLGWGDDGETTKPFVLRTTNNGTTWNQNWIDEEITSRDYTVTYRSVYYSWAGGAADFDTDKIGHTRIGDDDTTYNPWAVAVRGVYSCVSAVYIGAKNIADGILNFGGSTSDHSSVRGCGNDLLGWGGAAGEAYLDDYFGAGNWTEWAGINKNMPKESARKYLQFAVDIKSYDPQPAGSINIETWVFWNKPSPIMPKALDVAPMNSNWVYVGLTDKILRSEDGGFTWTVMTEDYGANDILVDPQLAGVIYVWNTDGDLVSFVGGLEQAAIAAETPAELPLRLARSVNLGRLWGLQDAADLKRRENASWTTQDTGLANATGLHAYLGERLIYLDAADIYFSGDGGGTISAKKGGWAEYAGGINAHLMRSE